jgi:hypothetical protein
MSNLKLNDMNTRIKEEFKLVQELGKRIGYGNMMGIATALWKKELTDSGCPSTSGAFHGVPKAGVKPDWLDVVESGEKIYDEYLSQFQKEIPDYRTVEKCINYDCAQGRHKCYSDNVVTHKCFGVCPFYMEKNKNYE